MSELINDNDFGSKIMFDEDLLKRYVKSLKVGQPVLCKSAHGDTGIVTGEIISIHQFVCKVRFPVLVTATYKPKKVTRVESFTHKELMIWNLGKETGNEY